MSKKLFIFFFLFFLLANSYSFAVAAEVYLPIPSYLPSYIGYFFWLLMISGGILAVVVLVLSGIQFIYSAGNPEKISDAKKKIISAILGLALLLTSFIIIQTINPKLKNLDPTEQLSMIGAFRFVGGRDGRSTGEKSGCGIDECLGLDGSCSWDNCGGYDYTGCEYGECLGEDETEETDSEGESCSPDNCISSISGCGSNQCLGLDESCAWYNCNWGIEKPAPLSLENTDEIGQKYSKIVWKSRNTTLAGNQVNTCDPDNPNAIYVLYLYRDYNFKNLFKINRIMCNDWRYDIDEAKSFMLIKETPGVYFYGNENCYPSEDIPPAAFTEGIPEGWQKEIKSVRIVNGPDPKKGPFFGLIYFSGHDYKTNEANPWAMEIQPKPWKWPDFEAYDNYSYCFPVGSIRGGSWVIYQWVGFEEDGSIASAGNGVTLHSRTGWLGGYYQLNGNLSRISASLTTTPVFYSSGSGVPAEERTLCSYFYPDKSCLKSFEIKGNYLVIVSSNLFRGNNSYHLPDIFNTHAQAFPISARLLESYKNREAYSVEKGTPELALDYIGWLKQAHYIEVIPLAGTGK